ncbi:lipid-binding SYLF domain-containing protein [Desulfolithobacter sp.]
MFAPLRQLTGIITIILVLTLGATGLKARGFDKPEQLVLQSEGVFKSFMSDPNMEWLRKNIGRAKGIFIIPQMLRGGFFIGGSGGSGVVLARDPQTGEWSYPAFYTIGSLSLGLQMGADVSEIILMIMTNSGMEAFLSTEFKLGGDISIAAGPVGASAKVQTVDILAFGRSKGAFGGVSVEGAIIAPRHEWNEMYYGKPVLPVDILIHHTVRNAQADNLVAAMPKTDVLLPESKKTRPQGKPLGY